MMEGRGDSRKEPRHLQDLRLGDILCFWKSTCVKPRVPNRAASGTCPNCPQKEERANLAWRILGLQEGLPGSRSRNESGLFVDSHVPPRWGQPCSLFGGGNRAWETRRAGATGAGCLNRHSDTCLVVQFVWTFLWSPVQLLLRWEGPQPRSLPSYLAPASSSMTGVLSPPFYR